MTSPRTLDPATGILGAALVFTMALTPVEPPPVQQDPVEPCCSITAIDAARRLVTLRHSLGSVGFEVLLADAAQLRRLRVGQKVSLSNASKALVVIARGASPQLLRATTIRPAAPAQSSGGAVASAASAPSGDFRRSPSSGGKCPPIKETPTEQCVLTHDLSGSGRGCEYFCVPIR